MWQTRRVSTILVTGFEPFGAHSVNPTEGLAKAVDGRRAGDFAVVGVVLPVHHADTAKRLGALLAETNPAAILQLGLAGGRARIALERVALNVMDYEVPDNAGFRASGEPCVPGGPTAYFSTLPMAAMLKALVDEGIPAYTSNTAGTYLCNQTLYWTLHAVRVGRGAFPALARVVDARAEPELARAAKRLSEKKYGWGDGLLVELDPAR